MSPPALPSHMLHRSLFRGPTGILLAGILSALLLNGCGITLPFRDAAASTEPVAVEPAQPVDEILALLPTLAAGQSVSLVTGGTARAEAAYDAASGRKCRRVAVDLGAGVETRLACSDGQDWAWFPYVLP